jgi:cyclic beta-1,2-glucan synthetase
MGLLTCLCLALGVSSAASAAGAEGTVRLSDASQQGTFNVGPARASVARVADPSAGGEVLRLDYTLPRGTAAGVWSKAFAEGLNRGRADIVRLAVKATSPQQAERVAAAIEIKGTAGTQRIPIALHPGWTPAEEEVHWPAIGRLNEVVVLIEPRGDSLVVEGSVDVDVRFERLSMLRELSTSVLARIGGVLLAACLGAGLVVWLGGWTGRRRSEDERSREATPTRAGLRQDLILGLLSVATAGIVARVYALGGLGPLETGWEAVHLACWGGLLGEWWTYSLTRRHVSSAELFRDMFVTGFLAASSSSLVLLQAPAEWTDLLRLSQTAAAAAVLVYHAANAAQLATSGRHLGAGAALLIAGAPYVVGALTLLASEPLMRDLGATVTARLLEKWSELEALVGRVLVLFAFNEAVAQGLNYATRGQWLGGFRAHRRLLAVAAMAAVTPWIAAAGSSTVVASWSTAMRVAATLVTTVLSQAGLWAEVYLITGMVMDAIHSRAPTEASAARSSLQGMTKGAIYSAVFMTLVSGVGLVAGVGAVQHFISAEPAVAGALIGAAVFPLVKTIVETFDGSYAFFRRVGQSYRSPILYARGAVVGLGLGHALASGLSHATTPSRIAYGFAAGAAAYAGIDLLRDVLEGLRRRGRVQSWRVYFVRALLGGSIGAAVGFYVDSGQLRLVVEKFHRYLAAGTDPERFDVRPLLSQWGYIPLGHVTGGVSLLFKEALAGVIGWSIPAWLFALNRTFMAAYFRRETGPIRALFTREGLTQLTQNMIEVLRWGLWMSPIINSFLRPVGDPTWYNQDGAVRTLWAIVQDIRLSPEEFRAWSLNVFIALLAHDWVRILIWLDHFGLRVATLVNLSFLGMDRLDQRLARFVAPAATARFIPEGVKRFTTWAPLVVPYYIPRGREWDIAWSRSQALRNQPHDTLWTTLAALPPLEQGLLLAGAVAACTALFATIRRLRERLGSREGSGWSLSNNEYEVTLGQDGAVTSVLRGTGYDVTRRAYDRLDPAGRALFLVEATAGAGGASTAWPILGNYPAAPGASPRVAGDARALTVDTSRDGLSTRVTITLPDAADPVELWTIDVENLSDRPRSIRVVPYLEWVLNKAEADRGHTQYNRLFAEMAYVGGLHAVLARDKHAGAMGLLAADIAPEGLLTARVDFIGRAGSVWTPRVLETLRFMEAKDTEGHPTFDPIGSLLLSRSLPARGSARVRLLIGIAKDKARAIDLVARHLGLAGARSVSPEWVRTEFHPIGHGEILPGTPRPYSEFSEDGRTLLVRTPFTPRPIDHTMSNGLGHVVSVTNRGLHTTSSVNAQQNRLTPDWPDTVTREVPSEAFYLHDPQRREWYSPTHHPLDDPRARHEVAFGVDGTATFRMTRDAIETELTVFVPPEEPVGVYLLTVRNAGASPCTLRLGAYFQMVLADQPEHAGPLKVEADRSRNALFFENPRNGFRTGPAFAAMLGPVEAMETRRGRFFGGCRDVARPYLVEHATPDPAADADDRPVAAFLATLELPANGESTVVVLMGQADDRTRAERIVRSYQDPEFAPAQLDATRRWWSSLMDTVSVRTTNPAFEAYLDWLKYQALAERIWARRGFYQSSGAFGFRDQLQDAINLIWMEPALARRQILLHGSQQFLEGDVVHWFHLLQDGRTGFVARTHASDNLLWLAWALAEYVRATGDASLLEERTSYLFAEQPFPPLPALKHGMGFDPLRSSREDTVLDHCLRAINLVLDHRMGAHGLPLIGTGDWNDGLDEIGSKGKGESVWLGFFLYYILDRLAPEKYAAQLQELKQALEQTWRGDRYLRAFHDDGTEIGVAGSGIWEIDALTAAWAVMTGINHERGKIVFETALRILEKEKTVLLGWPPLREDSRPYLGRSSGYPEGVRENGMYCHGVQWLVGAARLLADASDRAGQPEEARQYRATAYRLWQKISPLIHVGHGEIETYGGQANKQAADMVTTFDPGRMIWHGYTGAAGWMFRQALEGVLGYRLVDGAVLPPAESSPTLDLSVLKLDRDLSGSPLAGPAVARRPVPHLSARQPTHPT